MEFFGCNPSGGTLVLPALSIGNVGQLAVDLLISSLEVSRVGYLDDPNVLPCVGNDPFGPRCEGSLAVELELYGDSGNNLYILQQRSPLVKGRTLKYSENLADWAKNEGFQQIVILSGLDSRIRQMYDADGGQVHYISSASEDGNDERCERLGWKKIQKFRDDSEQFDLQSLRRAIDESTLPVEKIDEANYLSKLPVTAIVSSCKARGLNVLCLVCYCSEGDNVPDAYVMASAVDQLLKASNGGEACSKWRVPLSWSTVYGPPPDESIY